MSNINIIVPDLPESILEGTIVSWHKNVGDNVQRGELVAEIETSKVIMEIFAPETGILQVLLKNIGTIVKSKEILATISTNVSNFSIKTKKIQKGLFFNKDVLEKKNLSPATRRLFSKYNNVNENLISRTKNFNICTNLTQSINSEKKENHSNFESISKKKVRSENRIQMTNFRKCISDRLLKSTKTTVSLTTFNEVNMQEIVTLRIKYNKIFKQQHGINLGFMSFFIKATLEALKSFQEFNAFIDKEEIIYHNYFDINIAVSTPHGLITPILQDVDLLSFSEIEKKIKNFSIKGRNNKITIEDLKSGNFTITNGGVYGSMLSTPIINPPQSAILGIHKIKNRPTIEDNKIIIAPIMYLALSYDHRLIDGKEAINFLITIKNILENPIRLLLEI